MKAIVSSSVMHARQFMRFMELDQNEWIPLSPGSALAGYRFTKVVILPLEDPEMMSGVALEMRREWLDHLTTLKMRPEDQTNVFHL